MDFRRPEGISLKNYAAKRWLANFECGIKIVLFECVLHYVHNPGRPYTYAHSVHE